MRSNSASSRDGSRSWEIVRAATCRPGWPCARDAGIALMAQLLIYPVLDDRTGGPDALVDNPYSGEFVLSPRYLRQLWRRKGPRLTACTQPADRVS